MGEVGALCRTCFLAYGPWQLATRWQRVSYRIMIFSFDLHKEQLHLSLLKIIDGAKYTEDNGHFLKAVFSFYTWSFLLFCISLFWFSPCAREISFIFPLTSVIAVNSVGFELTSVKQKYNITKGVCSSVQALHCSSWNGLNTRNVFKIHVYLDIDNFALIDSFLNWIILEFSAPFSSMTSPPRMKHCCGGMQKQYHMLTALKRQKNHKYCKCEV